jgi:hypothetical protein
VDVTIQETTSTGKMKSIHKVCGGPWGGTRIDEEFKQFLIELVGADVLKKFRDECRSDCLDLMRAVELKKRKVDFHSNHAIQIRISPGFFELVDEHTRCNISEIISKSPFARSVTCLNDRLNIDINLFRSFFRNAMHDIINHLRDILENQSCEKLLGIVVVGGFAGSPFMIDSLKDAFPGKRIIVPMDAGLAVAKGTVLYGHNPDIICSRVCRYTYGDDVCEPFIEGQHPLADMTKINNKKYCRNIFRKFFEKGEKVSLGEKRSFAADYDFRDKNREHQREEPLNIKVYVSNKLNPKLTHDVGCRTLGEIIVKCTQKKWPEMFTCTIDMEIAGTEIQVSAEVSTGEKASANFDFL